MGNANIDKKIGEFIGEFNRHIEEIRSSKILVVVEGNKDRMALQVAGIDNIIQLSKKPLFQIVEEIADSNHECIILTDLDKEGKCLYSKLNSDLQKNGVKINNKFREFLFRHTKIRQIEGIGRHMANSNLLMHVDIDAC